MSPADVDVEDARLQSDDYITSSDVETEHDELASDKNIVSGSDSHGR